MNLKRFLVLIVFFNSFVFANVNLENIQNIIFQFGKDKIVYILIAFFVFLFLCIVMFFIKRNKKIAQDYLLVDKKQLQNQNLYLDNLLSKSLLTLEKKLPLTTDVQTIKCFLYEAKLYLNSTFSHSYKKELFYLSEFLEGLNIKYQENGTIFQLTITYSDDANKAIKFNKELLKNILYLIALLQFKEHQINDARAHISLLPKTKEMVISVDNYLELTSMLKEVIENNYQPIFLENSKSYKGIYLYAIYNFVQQLNGKLKIETENENYYKIEIILPVEIETASEGEMVIEQQNSFINKQGLIYLEDEELAQQIIKLLGYYNVKATYIVPQLNKELPDFSNFNFIILEPKELESIYIDFLTTLKLYHNLKIIAVSSFTKLDKGMEVFDYILTKPVIQSKIYTMLHELYNGAFKKIKNKSSSKLIETNKSYSSYNNSVLIADDDFVDLNLLKALLETYNINVITANDGEEVLKILRSNPKIDLIILDSQMPKLDAYKTVEEIRKDNNYNAIPIVLYTSENIEDRINTIFEAGFDTYLQKPIRKYKLETILNRYLHINESNTNKANKEFNTNVKNNKALEDFLTIYGNSDKLIEKYFKEERVEQAFTIADELQKLSKQLNFSELIEILEELKDSLLLNMLDSELMEKFSESLKKYKEKAIQTLSSIK